MLADGPQQSSRTPSKTAAPRWSPTLSAYARATPCPVLIWRYQLVVSYAICLRACYAMSGTQTRHGGTASGGGR
eukprot:1798993-Rhodomonas_salina.1